MYWLKYSSILVVLMAIAGASAAQNLRNAFQPHRTRRFDQDHVAGTGKFLYGLSGRFDLRDFHDTLKTSVARGLRNLTGAASDGEKTIQMRLCRTAADFDM